ncbi:hypothetical protein F3Y22_tig00110429pilonHSYRG00203 [Hibiscus syriacus]|uniref:Uncharacterized protein n=1 Tax=Hibiscus syriacus TaxID=106335 RepID=A0A6A3AQL4_HIBSY|nr:hypothetical protein F3Y22_tig00110429pilonHSYRG00203 [Hibiscus syriacus]
MSVFGAANDDILQNILFRLPATLFVSAACVKKPRTKFAKELWLFRSLPLHRLSIILFVHMVPEDNDSIAEEFNRGIVLIVGYLPGLEIKHYTGSVSGLIAPAGMIVFGDQHADLNLVLAEIDYVMHEETMILGDASSSFICKSGYSSQAYNIDLCYFNAVALVFAKDKDKPHGVMPFSPELRPITVTSRGTKCSWITVSVNGFHQIIDFQTLLSDIGKDIITKLPSRARKGARTKLPSSLTSLQHVREAYQKGIRDMGVTFIGIRATSLADSWPKPSSFEIRKRDYMPLRLSSAPVYQGMSVPEFGAFIQALDAILTRFQHPLPPSTPPIPRILIPKVLKSLGALKFRGEEEEDPMEVDLWLNDIMIMLESLHCSDSEKLGGVVSLLRGSV